MPRYTVSIRNHVSLAGPDPDIWGIDWTDTGPGQPAYYEVLRYQANGWSDLAVRI